MANGWRSLWHEPRPAGVPPLGRLDWLLAGAFSLAVLVEGVAGPPSPLRPMVIVLALAVAPAVLLRRRSPLVTSVAAWAVAGLLSCIQLATRADDLDLHAMMAVLILVYSLVRWGSGREIALGATFIAVVVALGMHASDAGWVDAFAGSVLVLLLASLAVVFRYRAALWRRRQRDIRNHERMGLARELHDTVAHHVSAIAVQAQAGRAVAAAHPGKAVDVLAAIESEASRTLAEMRAMVRVLRDDTAAASATHPGAADLAGLARPDSTPRVAVSLERSLPRLTAPVDAAIYRLAQESLTNALRHAHRATRVSIDVRRENGCVRLRVTDDGESRMAAPRGHGFGLLGMAERTHLLGGSFSAGPGPEGGWVVEAVLPAEAET